MRAWTATATLALVAAFAGEAMAQRGEGFGEFRRGMRWYPSLESVIDRADAGAPDPNNPFDRRRLMQGMENVKKKYIFVYVRPMSEKDEPNEFNDVNITQLSYNEWAFVKMDLDKENPHQKAWGIKGAPSIIGLDIHGNDFLKTAGLTLDSVRGLTRNLPEALSRFEGKLKNDYRHALDQLKLDEGKALKGLMDIVALGKVGYPEITGAQSKLNELSETAFRRIELAESVSLETGIEYLEDLSKTYAKTGRGAQAEIRIAQLDHERGNVQPAILRIQRILKYDPRTLKAELEQASAVLQEISKAGDSKIELALTGDRALMKDGLRKVSRDYAGTEAGKRAGDLAK